MAKFSELGLSESVMKGINEMGFTEPTPIQGMAIPLLFQGEDVIAQAKTGTGKTAAFGIYALEGIEYAHKKPQVLVLTPTRELCLQVKEEVAAIGKHTGASLAAVYGGADMGAQVRQFRSGVHIVVGTPGRVIDHLKRGTLSFKDVGLVVIDEADRMLDMGFIDDVEFILSNTPKDRQTLLFSATMPREIRALAEKHMRAAQFVKASEDETPVVTHIKQSFVSVRDPRDRLLGLLHYLEREKPTITMVFCRTKFGAEKLAHILHERGFKVDLLHGGLSQAKREQAMAKFRAGRVEMLVATDIAARGLDVDNVSHVVNYNLPEDAETYVHRVGRTGRMGKAGAATSIVVIDEMGKLGEIERNLSLKMEEIKFVGPERGPLAPRKPMHGFTGRRPSGGGSYGSRPQSHDSRPRGGQSHGDRRGGHGGGRGGGSHPSHSGGYGPRHAASGGWVL